MKSYENPYGLWAMQGRGMWLVVVSSLCLIFVLQVAMRWSNETGF